jgi:hypothetical protein
MIVRYWSCLHRLYYLIDDTFQSCDRLSSFSQLVTSNNLTIKMITICIVAIFKPDDLRVMKGNEMRGKNDQVRSEVCPNLR